MNFAKHSNLANAPHAFLSPSTYSWLRYEEDKLDRVFQSSMAAQRGTDLHNLAHECIRLGVKLPELPKALNMYVNDAIGFRMTSEVILWHSDFCWGTADTVGFRQNLLRIHDLKTGTSTPSMDQLKIYAALFCFEYKFKPFDIQMELRIYQNDGYKVELPEADEIIHIMDKITTLTRRLEYLRMEADS
jgi:hypothetical protein